VPVTEEEKIQYRKGIFQGICDATEHYSRYTKFSEYWHTKEFFDSAKLISADYRGSKALVFDGRLKVLKDNFPPLG
jgi:hypothetical protein